MNGNGERAGLTTASESQTHERRRRAALAEPLPRYERMVEIRTVEDTINALFASGVVHGTTHLCQGQEALAVGIASATRPDDAVTATYRGHGIALALGMSPTTMLAEILGRTAGCTGGVGGSMHLCDPGVGLLPTFAIVGAGLPVAIGAALAFQTRAEDRVALAVFGDGATNIGAFHESLNLAAVWRLPVVFICDNNVYGEYSRWDVTTPIEDLHRRADAYGMRSEAVDGMMVDPVRDVVADAVAQARSGGGPTLVEAKTYRFAGHSRSDTAPYRPDGELDQWRARDPLKLARTAILDQGITDEEGVATIESRVRHAVHKAVESASAMPAPAPAAMFSNVWAQPLARGARARAHVTT